MSDWLRKSKEILSLIFMFRKTNCLSIFCLIIALMITRIYVLVLVRYILYKESAEKLLSHPIFLMFACYNALSFRTLTRRKIG
jgi:NADH:ubiquinone oxidoreductase subunit 4 (subunit M)